MSVTPADEAVLVDRAAQRDPGAIASLYDLYAPKIYSYLYHRLSDPTLAEDLTGQVFLQMIETVRTEKGWRTSFSGWLFRIAHNLVIDHYRRRTHANLSDLDDSPNLAAANDDPFATVVGALDSDELMRAIKELTDEQAHVITLRFLEGYNVAEVSVLMGKSEGAIKALQYRAISNLRRIMGESLHDLRRTPPRRSVPASTRTPRNRRSSPEFGPECG